MFSFIKKWLVPEPRVAVHSHGKELTMREAAEKYPRISLGYLYHLMRKDPELNKCIVRNRNMYYINEKAYRNYLAHYKGRTYVRKNARNIRS